MESVPFKLSPHMKPGNADKAVLLPDAVHHMTGCAVRRYHAILQENADNTVQDSITLPARASVRAAS